MFSQVFKRCMLFCTFSSARFSDAARCKSIKFIKFEQDGQVNLCNEENQLVSGIKGNYTVYSYVGAISYL